nr:galactose-binding lectin PFL-96 [Pinctada fucata]
MYRVIVLLLLVQSILPLIRCTATRNAVVVARERTTAKLSCHTGSINILSAIYGKGPDNKWNVLDEVRKACDGRKSCSVPAQNSLFDDPAYGVVKDLVIAYECSRRYW